MSMNGLWYVSKSQGTESPEHLCRAPDYQIIYTEHRIIGSFIREHWVTGSFIGASDYQVIGSFMQGTGSSEHLCRTSNYRVIYSTSVVLLIILFVKEILELINQTNGSEFGKFLISQC